VFAPTDNTSAGQARPPIAQGGTQSQLLQTTSVFLCQQLFVDVTIHTYIDTYSHDASDDMDDMRCKQ